MSVPEELATSLAGAVPQSEMDHLMPSVSPLPSFVLPNDITSTATLRTNSSAEETELLSDSADSPSAPNQLDPESNEQAQEPKEAVTQDEH